jgi:hypothetical protein
VADNVVDIQELIAGVKQLGPAAIGRRISLLNDRAKLEGLAPGLAMTANVDETLAFLVIDVAWGVLIDEIEKYDTNAAFCGVVTAAVVAVLQGLAEHVPPTDGVAEKIYNLTLVRFSANETPKSIRNVVQEVSNTQVW